jgi:hypothetical protein
MQKTACWSIILLCLAGLHPSRSCAEDLSAQVRKAVEKSTLDQSGTHPFHLMATFAPSRERDKDSGRSGEFELWWQSPAIWRSEVRTQGFRQIAIQNGDKQWQKNDGDYYPEWLRQLTQAIVKPLPLTSEVLAQRVKSAEVRHLGRMTSVKWEPDASFGPQQASGGGQVALMDGTVLLYTSGPGWGGDYKDLVDFHGRKIAHTIAAGSIEVKAQISVLEDLGDTQPGFFDANAPGGDPNPIRTVLLSDEEMSKDVINAEPINWPAVDNGPFEGVVWTSLTLDRSGKVQEMMRPISDNPALIDAAAAAIHAMQFRPVLDHGVPVQATGNLRLRFKTSRPAGGETFLSAKEYFQHARMVGFLAGGAAASYRLTAEFQIGTKDGPHTGRYEDTWMSATQWRREAWYDQSHLVRTQDGDKRYVLSEGPEAAVLQAVMRFVEPLPAEDTMTESDWGIRRDHVDGVSLIRVFRGPEGPNGELEAGKSEGYWFDESGHLTKAYTLGFELRPFGAEPFGGVQVARRIDALKDGKVGMRITVKEITPPDPSAGKDFKLNGHEWQRAFTAETR